MSSRLTHEQFLEKLWDKNEHYKNGKFKVIGEYETINKPILVENKYGICSVRPVILYEGGNVTKKVAVNKTDYTINQFIEIHEDKYDYSKFEYINTDLKSTIICKTHGEFMCSATSHLSMKSGCSKCGDISSSKNRVKTTEQFIEDAKAVHGDRYDYSKVKYLNSHKKVEILCNTHGVFKQKPNAHLSGKNGCVKCNEWKDFKTQWLNTKSNYGILYMCKFYNDFESFIKIGITTTTVKKRYSGKKYSTFKYEIIEEIKIQNKNIIWSLEEQLKDILKNKKYTPLSEFEGYSECYKIGNFKEIYGEFKKITENYIT